MLTNRMQFALLAVVAWIGAACAAQTPINLPSSKLIAAPVPGNPLPLNSLPMAMAVSPDGRYVAVVNAGYGSFESRYMQSIAILDTATGKLADFPDDRTPLYSAQTLYSGLAFSLDGKHLYATFGSITAPEGKLLRASSRAREHAPANTGNAVAVYDFDTSSLEPSRLIAVPPQALAAGKKSLLDSGAGDANAIPFPSSIAVLKSPDGQEELLIANNLSDNAVLLDAVTGKILKSFDLSSGKVVPSTYPIAVAVSRDGRRGYVALWNASEIAELDLRKGTVAAHLALMKPASPTAPGSHPSALLLSPNGNTLYAALANTDSVAVINIARGRLALKSRLNAKLPGQTYFGAEPDALALSADGARLYVANAGSNAVAVFNTHAPKKALNIATGFIPTEWLPTSLAVAKGKLYVATGKGKGTTPNNMPQRPVDPNAKSARPFTYIATLLHGSLSTLDAAGLESELPRLTEQTLVNNRMRAAEEKMAFAHGSNPIRHVIYIIKENRTYDQVFGDLSLDGRPVGNGDPSLTLYGAAITPNQHKLALQFGVLDNFYDSAEVSADGHVWSTAAITSDYTEKTWQQDYRGGQRTYDFEGVVANGFPLLEGIPDVDEPGSSYLWTDLAAHRISLYHFGEFISSKFCGETPAAPKQKTPQQGSPQVATALCQRNVIRQGEGIPDVYGGGTSKYPWPIPLLAKNTATKPELVGHFDPDYPDFNLSFPDQLRVEVFLRQLKVWESAREQGNDTMPQFLMLRLPNDHTAGTSPGMPTPRASVADNDLAIGRAVDAISHSKFWDDTAFFILEDDAQNGADHVDAHRSTALVISKYSPRSASASAVVASPYIDSRFYTTVSFLRTMEALLGAPPMNNNDAFAPLISTLFTGEGDQPPFTADFANRDNGLIYTANSKAAPGGKESSKMDFRHEDRADPQKLNIILWKDAMGSRPLPAQLRQSSKSNHPDDDD